MSRTLRRKNQQHDYEWVLIDWESCIPGIRSPRHDPLSAIGLKVIARYHSDSQVTMSSTHHAGIESHMTIDYVLAIIGK